MPSLSKQVKWLLGLAAATLGIALVIVVPAIFLIGMDWGGSSWGTSYAVRQILERDRVEGFAVACAAMTLVWRTGAMRLPAAGVAILCFCLAALQLARLWFRDGWLEDLVRSSSGIRMALAVLYVWSLPAAGAALVGATRFNGALAAIRWLAVVAVCSPPFVFTLALLNDQLTAFRQEGFWFLLYRIALTAQTAALVAMPVLQLVVGVKDRRERTDPLGESAWFGIPVTCPRCREAQTVPVGKSRCTKCRLTISIEVEEPRCWSCRYLIYNLTSPRCPECGADLKAQEAAAPVTPAPSPGSS